MPTPSEEYIRIPLTGGLYALIDPSSLELVSRYTWHATCNRGLFYAVRNCKDNGGANRKMYMHRLILGLQWGDRRCVDHIEPEKTLDNRLCNLRIATHAENLRNRGRQTNNSSGFKGVGFDKSRGLWRAQIQVQGEHIFVGRFPTAKEAHEAYRRYAERLHVEFSRSAYESEYVNEAGDASTR